MWVFSSFTSICAPYTKTNAIICLLSYFQIIWFYDIIISYLVAIYIPPRNRNICKLLKVNLTYLISKTEEWTMNSKLNQHLFVALSYVMAIVASFLLGNILLLPICNSITGSETKGVALTQTLMRLLWPAIAFIIIFIYKKNGSEEKITFVAKLREEPYDFKKDFIKLMK